jgi:DNA-binding transcriptional ArsR family regulator
MRTHQQHTIIFQALGHPIRMSILEILAHGPICVCDLGRLTDKRQPYISQQLAVLRKAGLVTTKRQGWNISYQLNEAKLAELEQIISALLQQVHHT